VRIYELSIVANDRAYAIDRLNDAWAGSREKFGVVPVPNFFNFPFCAKPLAEGRLTHGGTQLDLGNCGR
jgi:hypothetical protein